MKKYILTLSFSLLCLILANLVSAQNESDSTKQELIQLPFAKVSKERLVGAVDVITSEDIMHSGYPSVSNALQGQSVSYVLGRIRGFARGGDGDQPLVVIDGLTNRSLGSLTVDEIESIEILKDVTAKMAYGSRGANGVIVVKTKRGINSKKKISVSGEYGMRSVNQYPEFVGAADYMKYRNQALRNDGKDLLYSDEEIGLAGSSYKYPDVDYYDMFANTQTSYQKANAQLIGGDEKTKYFFNLGYMGEDGLEKVGEVERTNSFNVRSNLDYKVNDIVSVNLDIAGRFYMSKGNHIGTNGLFSRLSSAKPNDYPMFISPVPNVDSLGTSDLVNGTNLYGDMVYSGYKRNESSYAQTNIGMDFDLNRYVKGLTGRIYSMLDINNQIAEGKKLTYQTLKPAIAPNGHDTLIVNGVYQPKGNETRLSDSYYRNMGGGANIDYDRTFGDHAITAGLSYLLDYKTVKTNISDMQTVQDDKGMNFGFRANYAYKNKYVAEISSSYMGSSRYSADNRWKLFNSFGASYVLSNEDFMEDVDFVDFLKVKASYGTIGYDQSFDYLLYNNYYQYWAGSYKTGVKNAETLVGTEFTQSGNPNLTFEESTEMNIGLSAVLFGNKLAVDAEYFTEQRTGMPTLMKYAIPLTAGAPNIVDNFNAVDNKGYELSIQFTDHAGDFVYSLGGKLTSFESTWSQYDELNDFSFQNITGTATDAIWGYTAEGFYTSADDVATWGKDGDVPLTSALGTVIPGDLKFKDMSDTYAEYTYNDNVINKYDRSIIGNSRPRYIYSLNLNLQYKNFSFYALGRGVSGYDRMTTWPTYYTNKGNVSYSKFAADAAVPTFDADGNAIGLESSNYSLPRLTTENSAHSYNANTFFMKKGYYFKLQTVELKYDFPKSVTSAIAAENLGVFVRADNILTISNEKDLDPVNPSSGLTSAPMLSTVSLGLKLGF